MFPITSRPTEGNKTGSWRTFRPEVNEKCNGCSLCQYSCPDDCITILEKKAVIDYEYCKGCLICMNVCPVSAIVKTEDRM